MLRVEGQSPEHGSINGSNNQLIILMCNAPDKQSSKS